MPSLNRNRVPSAVALTALVAVATGFLAAAASRPAVAATVTYCKAVCAESASAACYERCRGDTLRERQHKVRQPPPPPPPPPVLKDTKGPDWIASVFDAKGGGGNGGGGSGGGNGR